jgi:hypothetical protein
VHKFLVAALAAAVAVAGFAAVSQGGAGEAGTSWEFSLKPNKVKKPATLNAVIEPAKVDDQGTSDPSDDVYGATEKNTIIFPKGGSVDTSALARCKLTASDVGRGEECPGKTRIGEGSAVALVGGTEVSPGKRQGGTRLNAEVEAFNQKSKLLLVVQVCGTDSGPTTGNPCEPAGTPQVFEGKWSKVATKPTVAIPTPDSLNAIGTVVQHLELTTVKKTKTVKENGKEVLHSFVFTPEECGGKWKSAAKSQYSDGTSQTIKDTQKCKKP